METGRDGRRSAVFRYWTAKEAVLKSLGIGLTGLSQCRIIQIVDDHHLKLSCKHKEFDVEHFYFNGHIAAILAIPISSGRSRMRCRRQIRPLNPKTMEVIDDRMSMPLILFLTPTWAQKPRTPKKGKPG